MEIVYSTRPPKVDVAVGLLLDVQQQTDWPPPDLISPTQHREESIGRYGAALQHFCAYDHDTLVGYATAATCVMTGLALEPGTVEFGMLAVHPRWQRQGIATRLYEQFLLWYRARTGPAVLGVWADGPSRTLFDRHPSTRFYTDRLGGAVLVYHVL